MSPNSQSLAETPSDEIDDFAILADLRNREDPAALERGARELLRKYGGRLADALQTRYREVLGVDEIWDCVYDAAFRAWRSAERFDPGRGTLGGWLYRMSQNAAIDLLRSPGKRDPARPLDDHDPPDPPSVEAAPRSAELVAALSEAIDKLPPLQKAIIQADLAAGIQADDQGLAQRHRTTENSIRVSRYKALDNLRKWFQGRGYEGPMGWS